MGIGSDELAVTGVVALILVAGLVKVEQRSYRQQNQMINSRPTPVRELAVTINGVTHYGAYFVQHSTVYVKSLYGIKARQAGGSPPEDIARQLLSELVAQKPSVDATKLF